MGIETVFLVMIQYLYKDLWKYSIADLSFFRGLHLEFKSLYKRVWEFFKDKNTIVVFDREIGYGYEGVLCYELKSALYGLKNPPFVKGFIAGLGGRDLTTEHIIEGVKKTIELEKKGEISYSTEFLGLRLDELNEYDEDEFFREGIK